MKNIFLIITLLVITVQLKAQSTQQLKKQLQEIIAQKNATVGMMNCLKIHEAPFGTIIPMGIST
ncbi:hypothetical protein OHD16_10870 [Sphingobacterium sp. ML3W]|uniref:hypothetical protein n=1 Tax=Sphingobacterium sp. ML3W TaxID=1538644 RepID=UPI00249C14A8|nr:hypothetical protein [Sphingobacterium sp. ML3W]WFA80464.1 hypothetical protein OGI71_04015 [Sphingobacterium sp. ML3W]